MSGCRQHAHRGKSRALCAFRGVLKGHPLESVQGVPPTLCFHNQRWPMVVARGGGAGQTKPMTQVATRASRSGQRLGAGGVLFTLGLYPSPDLEIAERCAPGARCRTRSRSTRHRKTCPRQKAHAYIGPDTLILCRSGELYCSASFAVSRRANMGNGMGEKMPAPLSLWCFSRSAD
jgi:hypothetical protein